jgi:uncharacterized damage-inducible protein DinB
MTKRIVLLQALAATPKDLARLLKNVDEAISRRRPSAEQWPLADIINHLIYVEDCYQARLKRVIAEERPLLPYILPDETTHDSQASLAELLARFTAARAATLAFLTNLPAGSWQRRAVHETLGETSFRFLAQLLVDHDTEHLNQLVEALQQLRALPPGDPQPVITTVAAPVDTPVGTAGEKELEDSSLRRRRLE